LTVPTRVKHDCLNIQFFTSYVHEQGTYFRYHNLARGLVKLGQQVTIYGCDLDPNSRSRREERHGIQYEIVPQSWKPSVFSEYNHPLTAVRRAFRSYPRCDITHLFQPFLGAAVAWRRCPAHLRFYDWDDQWTGGLINGPLRSWRDRWPRLATRYLESRLPRWAGAVTCVGDYLADLARASGAPEVTIIHNGYWPTAFADRATARSRLGLRQDALYAGFMGRTTNELFWCFDALTATMSRHPTLRLALCGMPQWLLGGLPREVRERVDFLGQLTAAASQDFAAAVDVGLLPLDNTPFNQSRFPIKFSDHLATGNPLICSEVGEVGRLARLFPWAVAAGTTKGEWMSVFAAEIDRMARGDRRANDPDLLARHLSWDELSKKLLDSYRRALSDAGPRRTERFQGTPLAPRQGISLSPSERSTLNPERFT
jgi:glycosyltransferase involved in cell wall biosynthesis